jgi:hypothetical protein
LSCITSQFLNISNDKLKLIIIFGIRILWNSALLFPYPHAAAMVIHPTHFEPEDGEAACTSELLEILKKPQRARPKSRINMKGSL